MLIRARAAPGGDRYHFNKVEKIMIRLSSLKTIAAAAGACVAMTVATPANAFVYATSHLEIQNLLLTFDPTANVTGFAFNLTNTADINGSSDIGVATCTQVGPLCGTSPVLNARQAIAPPSNLIRPEDTYTFATPAEKLVNSFSRADSVITAAQLINNRPTAANQIAESLLNIPGTAAANAEIKSTTSLSATFSGSRTIRLAFDADPDQLAQIGGGSTGVSAQSNLNSSFTLLNNGVSGGSVSFNPNGIGAADCVVAGLAGVTCQVIADTQDLNFNAAIGTPGSSSNSFETANVFSHFEILISGLADSTYSVGFNAVTSTLIVAAQPTVVPEPGTMGLIGAALAGLAFTSVRRKRNQS